MIQANDSYANYEVQTQLNSCRICLQPCGANFQPYCQCKGNSQYVHQACLLEWAKRSIKYRTKQSKYYFNCDLCLTPIHLQTTKICKCKKWQDIKQMQGLIKAQICLLLSTAIVSLLVTIFCLRELLENVGVNLVSLILSIVFGLVTICAFSILFYKIFFSVYQQATKLIGLQPPTKNRVANSYTLQNL